MRSMTGYARATRESAVGRATVELRAVNHRYFKLQHSLPGWLVPFEGKIAARLKEDVSRGSLHLSVRVDDLPDAAGYDLDPAQLRRYREALEALGETPALQTLLGLPGVVVEREPDAELGERVWPLVSEALDEAASGLIAAREAEGAHLREDLAAHLEVVREQLSRIAGAQPARSEAYRERLYQRLQEILAQEGVELAPDHLVREVALYSDKIDIAEEISRLSGHVEAFAEQLAANGEVGRRLEFLAQEMGREANTIGSKGGEGEVLEAAIEIKSTLERIKEQLANAE